MRRLFAALALAPFLIGVHAGEEAQQVVQTRIVFSPAPWCDPPEMTKRLEPILSDLKSHGFSVASDDADSDAVLRASFKNGERKSQLDGRQGAIELRTIRLGDLGAYELTISATLWPHVGKHPWSRTVELAKEMSDWQQRILTASTEGANK
jgi:hypothetical protein